MEEAQNAARADLSPFVDDGRALGAGAELAPAAERPPGQGEAILSALREILETLVFALLVFLLVQSVWKNFKVEGPSMEPNLHEGQIIIVNHLAYLDGPLVELAKQALNRSDITRPLSVALFRSPERGDVLVFSPPPQARREDIKHLVKRLIGIPGDRVEIRQGRVFLNGHEIIEPYASTPSNVNYGPATVGPGELFVLGDNRANSSDSRNWGMLPLANVVGKAWMRYWPPSVWGLLQHYNINAQLEAN